MNGKLQIKTISKALVNKLYLTSVAEIILLSGLGVLAVTLHGYLRYPLSIPGHHGIEFMALLMLALNISRFKISGALFSLGVGIFLLFPLISIKDPFAVLVYMAPGFLIFISNSMIANLKNKFWISSLIGGLAYALIPISRVVIMFLTGYQYKSILTKGPLFVIMSFFAFGLVGALFTTGIFKTIRKN